MTYTCGFGWSGESIMVVLAIMRRFGANRALRTCYPVKVTGSGLSKPVNAVTLSDELRSNLLETTNASALTCDNVKGLFPMI